MFSSVPKLRGPISMKKLRLFAAAAAMLGFAGWLSLRKPHSPTDELPGVAFAAFQISATSPAAGQSLAATAACWPGVRAATYNPTSDVLAVIFTEKTDAPSLQSKLSEQAKHPVLAKNFEAPAGPKCPVPVSAIAAAPSFLLGVGMAAAGLWLLTFWPVLRKPQPLQQTDFQKFKTVSFTKITN